MKLILASFLCLLLFSANSQEAKDSKLYLDMLQQDSIFFDKAFNKCDFDYLEKTVHPEVSFYHDQGGYQDRKKFFEQVRQNICNDPVNRPIRKLVRDSFVVFPLHNNGILYGAIQQGVHQFFRKENGVEKMTSIARFTHVYVLENGTWLLKEVLSFDHKSPQ